jgi:pilus assembly protein CpaC
LRQAAHLGRRRFSREMARWFWCMLLGFSTTFSNVVAVVAQPPAPPSVIHKVQAANDRIRMIVNDSRLLVLEQRIPELTMWNESKTEAYVIDVLVDADARELTMRLQDTFPKASLRVVPLPNAVMISGFVDDPSQIAEIVQIAEQFHPQVINNIRVGGVQQVLLQVKVFEVSRTKLRQLGIDWAELTNSGSYVASAGSSLLRPAALLPTNNNGVQTPGSFSSTGNQTFSFGVIDNYQSFAMFIQALRQDNLAKILAEPQLVTVSGRPAYFNAGGEFPILVPNSLGTVAVQYRPYGVQVDFVPIVLGNGGLRLEVRPRVSEIDTATGTSLNGVTVPGLKVREIDTGVEMRAGQTLAIGGLISYKSTTNKQGIPFLSELPYVGMFFGTNSNIMNEVELLVMVTPHYVDAMDPHEVPQCGPGTDTTEPTDFQLYLKNHVEVPKICPPGAPGWDWGSAGTGVAPMGETVTPQPGVPSGPETAPPPAPAQPAGPTLNLPPPPSQDGTSARLTPSGQARPPVVQPAASVRRLEPNAPPPNGNNPLRVITTSPAPNQAAPQAAPVAGLPTPVGLPPRNPNVPNNPNDRTAQAPNRTPVGTSTRSAPGFIGPLGYDDLK